MSVRFLTPLALCALAFSGCDFIDDIQQEPGVAVTISSVEIADLRQRPWDDDRSGPDLFVEVQDPGGGTYVRSEIIPDADLSETFTFTLPEGFEVATATSNMFVVVFDEDEGGRFDAQVVGVSQSFTADDVSAAQDSLQLLDFSVDDGRDATYTLVR